MLLRGSSINDVEDCDNWEIGCGGLQAAALKGDGLSDVFLLQADGRAVCASISLG